MRVDLRATALALVVACMPPGAGTSGARPMPPRHR